MSDIFDHALDALDSYINGMDDYVYISHHSPRKSRSPKKLICNFCKTDKVFWEQTIEGYWRLHEYNSQGQKIIHCCKEFTRRYDIASKCDRCIHIRTCKFIDTYQRKGCIDFYENKDTHDI